ncbi:MAG: protein-L-isoaspartate(D-aspartate) O-methyltransferase [Anaerolineae bacterium]|nr:protein-L-isoaspartate(D-aspartate) O-methyltransferase [Anaerolineae bacterium]
MSQTEEASDAAEYARQREQMVKQQIQGRGITDPAVLAAMRTVPREAFVPSPYRQLAYDDSPLPIPANQTISQPYIVGYMIAALALRPGDRVLEIGAGSGYAAALLSRIVREVYAVERHLELVDYARERLARLGYDNVWIRHGDGTQGWPEHAPYGGIIVAAGGPAVPEPLKDQLAIGGRLIMPVGHSRHQQTLVRITRTDEATYRDERLVGVAFVPLIGDEGW